MPGEENHTASSGSATRLKRLLLGFWAVWLTVVFVTNVLDAAKVVGLLGEAWTFASGNYHLVAQTTSRYGTPDWLNALMFLGVLGWEGLAAVLFGRACLTYRGRGSPRVYPAFMAGLSLWAAFALADEVFISYAMEAVHLRLFTAQLASLLAVELLPEASSNA
jgi:hypothetical protein